MRNKQGQNVVNGAKDWIKETPKQTPRTYTTQTGVVWPLRGIPAMLVRQLYNDQTGKPEPPVVDVTYGKKTVQEPNEKDPDYIKALDKWNETLSFRIMVYVLTRGVCDEPGKIATERLREFFPGATDSERKYAWILESFDSDEEAGIMMNVILGQTVPTEGGIRAAEDTFPGDDQPE